MFDLISRFRPFFVYAGFFSLFINILLLIPSIYMLQVFDRVLTSRSGETLAMLTVGALIALVVMGALDLIRSRLLAAAGIALDSMLGPKVLDGLLSNSAKLGSSDYVHGLRDVASLRAFLTGNGIISLFDAPWLPFYILLIFFFHPAMGITAIFGAAALVLLAYFNERVTRKPIENLQASSRVASRFIDSSLRNAEVVGALGMLGAITQQWEKQNRQVQEHQATVGQLAGRMGGVTKVARQAIQILMLCVGAALVIEQHVSGGVMMAATIILSRALAPVESMIASWKQMVDARSAFNRLDALLKEQHAKNEQTELPTPCGELSCERIVFTIPRTDRPIIKGISFQISSGESIGMIGPSASGKSTLARLLIGLWHPTSGTVRLDGADISLWPRESLGPWIGYLPQDVELFPGTVAENICRMKELDSEAVIHAAQRANAHDMILRLPKGYDTPVGEGGAALSGGQRQRVALARALYGSPRLVVLDEPNANLDAEGESALVRAMNSLKKEGITVIVVSHRPSLLAGVDKLLVLREGTIEAFGPRNEVLAKFTPPAIARAV
ncbi:MAG: type I secretion system permease/ATPase [Rhodocyclaceae bacterium]|nr:type I secretion system permease/ATPase [Rhodocyclaceae bacterium]